MYKITHLIKQILQNIRNYAYISTMIKQSVKVP